MRGLSRGAALGVVAVAAGCGGKSQRQDADEPRGTWNVEVVEAEFPSTQKLARQETMRIRVRNADDRVLPNVAVTVEGFSRRSEQPGLADPTRPVWILDNGPRGGTTAYTNTWALGRIPPGGEKTFEWRATPVRAGTHRLTYKIAAGLDGKAKARTSGGQPPQGSFNVQVDRKPADARVDPETGDVIRD